MRHYIVSKMSAKTFFYMIQHDVIFAIAFVVTHIFVLEYSFSAVTQVFFL